MEERRQICLSLFILPVWQVVLPHIFCLHISNLGPISRSLNYWLFLAKVCLVKQTQAVAQCNKHIWVGFPGLEFVLIFGSFFFLILGGCCDQTE